MVEEHDSLHQMLYWEVLPSVWLGEPRQRYSRKWMGTSDITARLSSRYENCGKTYPVYAGSSGIR
jgi:hypothetical protein